MRIVPLAMLGVGLSYGALSAADEPKKAPPASAKPVQTEVDGVVISAVAWRGTAPAVVGYNVPRSIEIIVRPKDASKPIMVDFPSGIELLDDDGDPIHKRGNGSTIRSITHGGMDPDTKTQSFLVSTHFFSGLQGNGGGASSRSIPGIAGTVVVADAVINRFEFKGAECKPNGVAKCNDQEASLSMFDIEDGFARIDLRMAQNSAQVNSSVPTAHHSPELTLVFRDGKKQVLKSTGRLMGGGGHPAATYAQTFRFSGPVPSNQEPIAIIVSLASGKSPGRPVKFKLQNVPIHDGDPKRPR
jgi:hypothetical protein